MAKIKKSFNSCENCGKNYVLEYKSIINAVEDPEYKEKILDGSLWTKKCPHCGKEEISMFPFSYVDKDRKLYLYVNEFMKLFDFYFTIMNNRVPDDVAVDECMDFVGVESVEEAAEIIILHEHGYDFRKVLLFKAIKNLQYKRENKEEYERIKSEDKVFTTISSIEGSGLKMNRYLYDRLYGERELLDSYVTTREEIEETVEKYRYVLENGNRIILQENNYENYLKGLDEETLLPEEESKEVEFVGVENSLKEELYAFVPEELSKDIDENNLVFFSYPRTNITLIGYPKDRLKINSYLLPMEPKYFIRAVCKIGKIEIRETDQNLKEYSDELMSSFLSLRHPRPFFRRDLMKGFENLGAYVNRADINNLYKWLSTKSPYGRKYIIKVYNDREKCKGDDVIFVNLRELLYWFYINQDWIMTIEFNFKETGSTFPLDDYINDRLVENGFMFDRELLKDVCTKEEYESEIEKCAFTQDFFDYVFSDEDKDTSFSKFSHQVQVDFNNDYYENLMDFFLIQLYPVICCELINRFSVQINNFDNGGFIVFNN